MQAVPWYAGVLAAACLLYVLLSWGKVCAGWRVYRLIPVPSVPISPLAISPALSGLPGEGAWGQPSPTPHQQLLEELLLQHQLQLDQVQHQRQQHQQQQELWDQQQVNQQNQQQQQMLQPEEGLYEIEQQGHMQHQASQVFTSSLYQSASGLRQSRDISRAATFGGNPSEAPGRSETQGSSLTAQNLRAAAAAQQVMQQAKNASGSAAGGGAGRAGSVASWKPGPRGSSISGGELQGVPATGQAALLAEFLGALNSAKDMEGLVDVLESMAGSGHGLHGGENTSDGGASPSAQLLSTQSPPPELAAAKFAAQGGSILNTRTSMETDMSSAGQGTHGRGSVPARGTSHSTLRLSKEFEASSLRSMRTYTTHSLSNGGPEGMTVHAALHTRTIREEHKGGSMGGSSVGDGSVLGSLPHSRRTAPNLALDGLDTSGLHGTHLATIVSSGAATTAGGGDGSLGMDTLSITPPRKESMSQSPYVGNLNGSTMSTFGRDLLEVEHMAHGIGPGSNPQGSAAHTATTNNNVHNSRSMLEVLASTFGGFLSLHACSLAPLSMSPCRAPSQCCAVFHEKAMPQSAARPSHLI